MSTCLREDGLLQVVRTRRVRATEERFYGRTARMFYVEVELTRGEHLPGDFNDFEVAARESATAYRDGKLWGSSDTPGSRRRGLEFWERMAELVTEFDSFRGRARRCTDSPMASIPPSIRRCLPAGTETLPGR